MGANAENGTCGASHTNGVNGTSYVNGVNGESHTNGGNGIEPQVPIAICGMALRLPGGSSSPQEFWDFLLAKGDARMRVPESRYNVSAYHTATKRPGSVASEYGYFLDESVKLGALDTSRFTLSRAELEFADPQQRRLLEVVREAFDDAGDVNFRGKPIGCYVGNMGEDWGEMMNRDPLSHGPNRIDGYNDWMLGNRISYEFGLKGPSMTIRTACSSALIGLNEACASIQRGVSDGAIIAGCTLIMTPGTTQSMTEKGILSPEGSCKSFSADADGYARGEAVTAIYIKPLDAAVRDGNPIRAVIRATTANSDGKTQGITQPNPEAHEAMIRQAYKLADIKDFSKTAYFECHGTGTSVGDPIETGAVGNVFGDSGIHITSVKPNVGHTEGASGLVSLIKAVMSLEHRTIPPNIKFNTPNPKIPFKKHKLTVPVEPTPFPDDREERVSVNSFGLGGSNAHVIVDSARSFNIPKRIKTDDCVGEPQLLLFSAASAPSLKSMVGHHEEWLSTRPEMADHLNDLAYTLANRREHLSHRAFKVIGKSESPASPGKKMPNHPSSLVMVFTGQGAQWPRMGRELLLRDDLCFQKTIRTLDKHLKGVPQPPEWTIDGELKKSAKASGVQKAELSQPLCTAIQIGLVDLFAAIGVKPEAVVGHSSGELAAAYASGALTAKEAIIGAYRRGQAAKLQNRKGAMAAIGLGRGEVEQFLKPPKVVVACENSSKSVTLSGDAEEVQAVVSRIKEEFPDVTARMLKVEKAYHSYHMREIGQEYCESIKSHLEGKVAMKPFFSSVSGSGKPEQRVLDAKYWQQNLQSPVLFNSAMVGLLEHVKNPAFLEIGPHGALAGPARQIFAQASASPPYFSAMSRNEHCVESYLSAVGKLFELNIPLAYAVVFPERTCLQDLPRYPWNHESEYWSESRMSYEWRYPKFAKHPLLGRRQLECTSLEPSFRNMLNLDDAPWLRDHMIQGTIIFPAAGYLAMAGEASRQLSGGEDSYSLRHVVLSQALILQEGVDTEIVTNLRPYRLTDSEDSEWWEFTIASYNGQTWVKHCVGQVSDGPSKPAPAENVAPLPRKLERKKVFDILAKAGMQYGPNFQRLREITAGTLERKAASSLTQDINGDEHHYHLHPAVIDAALQSGLVAANYGKIDPNNCAAMPTLLERATIFRCDPNSDMKVTAATDVQAGGGEISGVFQCIADGKIVLDMLEARFTPLDTGEKQSEHHLPITARVNWRPHIDFLDVSTLFKPEILRRQWTPLLDELGDLCVVFFHRRIESATNMSESSTTQHFAAWIRRQFHALGETHPMMALDNETIIERAHGLGDRMASSPVASCSESLLRVGGNIDQLLSGEQNIMELLQTDDTLTKLYASGNALDRSEFIQSVAHARPNLRVLEIGVGTVETTASFLKELVLPNGEPQYSKYTFTHMSSAPFADAKKRFADHQNMEYRVLDLNTDLAEQSFADTEYDLIIATNTIHATKSLSESLARVRKLLAPNGRLLLQELYTQSKWINCVLGLLDDWWNGEHDGRSYEPYVTPTRWQSELERAGFARPDLVFDAEEPHQLNAVMIAKPEVVIPRTMNNIVTILYDQTKKNVDVLSQALQSRGYAVHPCQLGDELLESQDIISLIDDNGPFFENPSDEHFKAFQNLLVHLDKSGLFWITRPSQVQCQDPRYAQIIGAARSVRNEDLTDFATCEVDDVSASLDAVIDAFVHFQKRQEDEILRPDYEYAIIDGVVNVPRIYPFTFADEPRPVASVEDRVALVANKPGRLASLQWKSSRAEPIAADQVEVEIFAAGLSLKDVTDFLGANPYSSEGLGVGSSGVVSRVGPETKELVVGDRVMCLGAGSFASHLTTYEALCVKIPDDLSFEEAATVPVPYVTATLATYSVGNLQPGQSILIHSACSGVGMAALQLAILKGVEIYATVGSEAKIEYLVENFGLPRHQISSSRDATFVDMIMRGTDGRGVDLALNSLSGDLLHATWRCVAEFGKVVEIGTGDLLGAGKLDMTSFLGGRSYTGVNLSAVMARKQSVVGELLHSTTQLLRQGSIRPSSPWVAYNASAVHDAIKHVQDRDNFDKIVLVMRNADGTIRTDAPPANVAENRKLDSSASYLLAGGLGGIGSVIARHLVEHGARRLVCLSRNPGSRPGDADTIGELESMGCEIRLVQGDMVDKADVLRALQQAPNLKGILHSPMLLQDETLRKMKLEQWVKVSNPKVKGAWNLHEATLEHGISLDFFVFLSSMSGLNGQPGQANYAGANTFLDAFAQYRNNLGLAASSIDIGAVADMGYAARDEALLQRLIKNGYSGVTEGEMIEAFTVAVSYQSTKSNVNMGGVSFVHRNTFATGFSSIVSLSNPESRSWWKKDIRMAVWHNIDEGADEEGSGGDSFKSFLAGAKHDPDMLRNAESVSYVAHAIGKQLMNLLLKPEDELDITLPVAQLGLDSLVGIEMRSWWRKTFGFDISVLQLLGMGTLEELGRLAVDGLLKQWTEG
ncbi:hypothetical protein BDV95DRAFT_624920 [Massariosphaeria phaeospora]|uniref:Uncharacterized protein n=1 Tax=Massariosphaeria phaeospora TaxID=100035 RepID=A0A7C8IRU9_9PLEO|nr:hypothetical protein BDV95DRAFT_624920 [Massariosphaeria phaeospora]